MKKHLFFCIDGCFVGSVTLFMILYPLLSNKKTSRFLKVCWLYQRVHVDPAHSQEKVATRRHRDGERRRVHERSPENAGKHVPA